MSRPSVRPRSAARPDGEPIEPHVGLVTWDDDPPVGGQGIYVGGLRRALQRAGVSTTTVAGQGVHKVRYRHLTGHGPLDMSIALNRRKGPLATPGADLLHICGGPGGVQVLRRPTVPVVYTAFHTFEMSHPLYRPQRWYGRVEARSYRIADALIAISRSTAASLIRMGIPHSKIEVIPPGLDQNRFVQRLGYPSKRMLFVGRLEPEKGPLDALSAMQKTIDDVPGATGVIAGTGSLRKNVESRVRHAAGIEYRGFVCDDELLELYASADVVLVPSTFEGFGLVALEACASGCGVVAYDVPGLREAVSGRGLLVPHGDVDTLADACRSLLTDQDRREDLVAAAISVREQYSWDRLVQAISDLYTDVIDGARHR